MGLALSAVPGVEEQLDATGSRFFFNQLQGRVVGAELGTMTHDELEEFLHREGHELLRRLYQEHLDARAGGKVEGGQVEGADGVTRSRVRALPCRLETRFGTVVANRAGYAAEGVESLVPMDAALNLPPRSYSYPLQHMVAGEAARGSFDNVVETVDKYTGAHVPKRQAQELAQDAAVDFAEFYRLRHVEALQDPDSSSILAMTSDGVGVRVLPAARREKALQVEKEKESGLLSRRTAGEKPGLARMVTVAAVYTVAPCVRTPQQVLAAGPPAPEDAAPRPEHKRVLASIKLSVEATIVQAFEEACYRDPQRKKTWLALVDGNTHQINVFKRQAKAHKASLTIIVDIFHVSEYVWRAANVFHPDDKQARTAWVEERLTAILEGKSSRVAAGMRRSATLQDMPKSRRKPIDDCARYLLNKKEFLRYDVYLARGFPIGTGVIEGAGRYLVDDRMDIAGARWGLKTAEAVLQLRALKASGDFDAYWKFHLKQELHRNHTAKFKDGVVPPPESPPVSAAKPHLRLVPS